MRFGNGADSSTNVEDRRTGGSVGGFGSGGGLGGLPIGPRGLTGGIGGLVLMVVMALLTKGAGGGVGGGGGIGEILNGTNFPTAQAAPAGQAGPVTEDGDLKQFTGQVFNDVQDFWQAQFAAAGVRYNPALLVLFDTPVPSGCGGARAEVGPHYCPPDQRVFIELGFMKQLSSDFGAAGDFAQAYVIAHEMGHHVQNELGVTDKVHDAPQNEQVGPEGLSVRLELQADCYAGVWSKSVYDRKLLDPGDVDEALGAAAAVGDDRLQQQSGGQVNPESWTHGSSEGRQYWFNQGYTSGIADVCDTFSPEHLNG